MFICRESPTPNVQLYLRSDSSKANLLNMQLHCCSALSLRQKEICIRKELVLWSPADVSPLKPTLDTPVGGQLFLPYWTGITHTMFWSDRSVSSCRESSW